MQVLNPESHAYASQIETHKFGAVNCDSYIHTTYLYGTLYWRKLHILL